LVELELLAHLELLELVLELALVLLVALLVALLGELLLVGYLLLLFHH
jgi:hypothetical protein